jgi:hypothetical protein
MLDKLVIAIESDGGLDVSRVAGFMQKVRCRLCSTHPQGRS